MQRCDVVLMYLIGAKKVSIGTMIEAGWADAYRKPVVLVLEDPTHKVAARARNPDDDLRLPHHKPVGWHLSRRRHRRADY